MRSPVCFACGQPTGPLPNLGRLPDGRVCPTCRDRLFATLPALLPAPVAEGSEEWAEGGEAEDDPASGA